jgi:hypothetical protein
MPCKDRVKISAAFLTLLAAFAMSVVSARAQPKTDTPALAAQKSVTTFLQARYRDKTTQYIAAFTDLNGDGTPEALVYLIGSEVCGSGGCNLLILEKNGDSWKIVTRTTVTQLPIRVLSATSYGWHNITVWVQGGGIQPGYEAELRFNGKTYPANPSAPPAQRLKRKAAGKVAIDSKQTSRHLYGNL